MTSTPSPKDNQRLWRVEMYMTNNGWVALVGHRHGFDFVDYVAATFKEAAFLAEQHIDRVLAGQQGPFDSPGPLSSYLKGD